MNEIDKKWVDDLILLGLSITTMLIGKRADYGPDNIMPPSDFGFELRKIEAMSGVNIRLTDKLMRAKNLCQSGKIPANESLRDTYMDIAGYAMIQLMLIDETWEVK